LVNGWGPGKRGDVREREQRMGKGAVEGDKGRGRGRERRKEGNIAPYNRLSCGYIRPCTVHQRLRATEDRLCYSQRRYDTLKRRKIAPSETQKQQLD